MNYDPKRCCATVYQGMWPQQCSKPVKARIGNQRYCTIHNPDRVPTDKQQAVIDARNAKATAIAARERLNEAAPDMLNALNALLAAVAQFTNADAQDWPELGQARAAVAKAGGAA